MNPQETLEYLKQIATTKVQLIEQQENYIQKLEEAKKKYGETSAEVKNLSIILEGIPKLMSKISPSLSAQSLSKKIEDVKTNMIDVSNSGNIVSESFKHVSKTFEEFGKNQLVSKSLALITTNALGGSKAIEGLGNSATIGNNSIGTLTGAISNLSSYLSKIDQTNTLSKVLAPFIESQKAVAGITAAENSLISLIQTTGGIKNIDLNDFVKNIDANFQDFSKRIINVANATSTSFDETMDAAKELALVVPRSLNQVFSSLGSSEPITALEAAMKVAAGTTGNLKDATSALGAQFANFGKANEDALAYLAQTSDLARNLGVTFNTLQAPVAGISKQFRLLGDNTEAAIKLFGGVGRALKDSGVGPEAMADMVQGLATNISNLDMAQKSFLSSSTGGMGGLQGGFQVDLALQEGKLDQVFQQMQQSLTERFGKIRNLEEAANDPGAAADLQRQVMFLTQGPFGQIVKSQQEAYKLLEAFTKGTDPKEVKEKDAALDDAMSISNEIQKKQSDTLINIYNSIEAVRVESALGNKISAKKLVGFDGEAGEELLRKLREETRTKSVVGSEEFGNKKTLEADALLNRFREAGGMISSSVGLITENTKKSIMDMQIRASARRELIERAASDARTRIDVKETATATGIPKRGGLIPPPKTKKETEDSTGEKEVKVKVSPIEVVVSPSDDFIVKVKDRVNELNNNTAATGGE